MDLGSAFDAQLVDQLTQERFGALGRLVHDHVFELVGDRREVGVAWRLLRLDRRDDEVALLGGEVFEAFLEASEAFLAALGVEGALLEGLEVALDRGLDAGHLRSYAGQPSGLGPTVQADQSGVSAGAQAQAEAHVTERVSITFTAGVTPQRNVSGGVDLNSSAVVGTVWHF